jgi:aromatic-L-amino-acid decarboxylase
MSLLAPDADRDVLLARLHALERAARVLEPGTMRRKKLRQAVVASAERFLGALDGMKAYQQTEDRGAGLLQTPLGEDGIDVRAAIAVLEEHVLRPGANTATGRHLAYIPGSGLYHAALGDFLAAATNKYPGFFFSGPGPVRMENMLLRWAADLVGYPPSAGGYLASGGSIATLSAVAAARDAHRVQGAAVASSVVYTTDHAHHCLDKALQLAGLGAAPVRRVAMDERFRMRPEALSEAIAADRQRGLVPWLVVAAAGTTDTGAIDPLEAIAAVAEREGCWFHVDAAYGGFFLLTDHGRGLLAGIERSDSVVLDPHKGLFMPYGSGILLVRDVKTLLAGSALEGAYMQDALRDPGEISPCDVSPELTKPFRALRMWLPLILLGVRPFRAALEEKLLLARYFHREVQALGFEVGPEPELSIVTYRWAPRGCSLEQANAYNKALVEGVQRDGRVFLSSTLLSGRFTLRLVALSFRTHRRTIDLALRVLAEQAAALG